MPEFFPLIQLHISENYLLKSPNVLPSHAQYSICGKTRGVISNVFLTKPVNENLGGWEAPEKGLSLPPRQIWSCRSPVLVTLIEVNSCTMKVLEPKDGSRGIGGMHLPTSPNYIHYIVLKLHIHILTQCRVEVVKLDSQTKYIDKQV